MERKGPADGDDGDDTSDGPSPALLVGRDRGKNGGLVPSPCTCAAYTAWDFVLVETSDTVSQRKQGTHHHESNRDRYALRK